MYDAKGRPQLPPMSKDFNAHMGEDILQAYLKQMWGEHLSERAFGGWGADFNMQYLPVVRQTASTSHPL